jgi:uncharacterized membrane protein YoaK (UPF0700 family)
MMTQTLDALKDTLGDFAKDVRMNVGSLQTITSLNAQQLWGTIVACAIATRNQAVTAAAVTEASSKLSAEAMTAAGLICLFVVGVVIGGTVARRVGEGRRAAVLLAEALLLFVAATLGTLGHPGPGMIAAVLAMGVENAVFQKQGDVGVGLTYMTGTLVRMGQRITTALHGGPRWDWLPFLALWLALSGGGALGALSYLRIGVLALWLALAVVVALAAGTWLAERTGKATGDRGEPSAG